jgi:hypothetical protein
MVRSPQAKVMPLSAAFLDGGYVEVIYPQHRELRTWPFWEVLEHVRAEPAATPYDERRSPPGCSQ